MGEILVIAAIAGGTLIGTFMFFCMLLGACMVAVKLGILPEDLFNG